MYSHTYQAVKIRCVVVDRDGTLIRHVPYLHEKSHVELLPTVLEGLQALKRSGIILLLHTNQSGIGRGYFAYADAVGCNSEMIRQIGLGGGLFERVCIAPERPEDSTAYRKPSPRFGLDMMEEFSIARNEMCYIGDNVTDLLTAKHVGCLGVGVNTGPTDLRLVLAEYGLNEVYPVFDTFLSASNYLLEYERFIA